MVCVEMICATQEPGGTVAQSSVQNETQFRK